MVREKERDVREVGEAVRWKTVEETTSVPSAGRAVEDEMTESFGFSSAESTHRRDVSPDEVKMNADIAVPGDDGSYDPGDTIERSKSRRGADRGDGGKDALEVGAHPVFLITLLPEDSHLAAEY